MKKSVVFIFILTLTFGAWSQNVNSSTIVIQTNGVCQTCHDIMKKNIPYFKGVTDFSYDNATSKVTVTYNPKKITPDDIRNGIAKLGYNADHVKADPKAREKLPACCKNPKSSHSGCSHHKSGGGCGGH